MKGSFLGLAASLTTFLLFALITTKPSLGQSDHVFDTKGNPLRWGRNYYILPIIRGSIGGGLTLGSHNKSGCPLYVTQEHSDLEKGLSVAFSHKTSKLPFVSTRDPLSITTTGPVATCKLSLTWKVIQESTTLWLVSTNGRSHLPNSKFRIVFYQSYYLIAFCPPLPEVPMPVVCPELGIYYAKDGTRYLAFGNGIEPLKFVFEKADLTNSQNLHYIETVV
ncbi:Kunitz trypsin inhibitor [Quillaja saponaria]|uniref:Kunitz trypsin inhibitor n=1 Tax=Quillaja saponaria TaxID=32244 RepID=A0AAD7VGZ8_QUISA|nr:Kunitz trypsin inhibitor [Quillaja saponaria]KAJ7975416.1 Kunitz trypsin inhibitor [Quillaja saponaria]